MVKKVKQFRFFGDVNSAFNALNDNGVLSQLDTNEPEDLTSSYLISGDKIFGDYYPIIQLGIQGVPGTKFYLNGNLDPIFLGASGIFELDLTNSSTMITALSFDRDSIGYINSNPDGYLIIDIVYQED